MSTSSPIIAREGWPFIAAAGVGAALVAHYYGAVASIPLWLLALLLLFIYRDPEREIPSSPLAVVSPVDGRILFVENRHDPYQDREAVWIGIGMFHHGSYSTRSPVEGKALQTRALPDAGNFQPPGGLVGGAVPHGVWLQTDEGDAVVVLMNRGPLHNPPRCYVQFGERVGQGQRCGFITLGSRVDVILPINARVTVSKGDRVRGGADTIATLVHK